MRLQSLITAALVSCVASCVLDCGTGIADNSQMGPSRYKLPGRSATLPQKRSQRPAGRKVKFKRDGSVTGFFDDDYANDEDWERFTNKGGALVRQIRSAPKLHRLTPKQDVWHQRR
jgi:hypothetical protein